MIVTRGAQRAIIAAYFAILAVFYGAVWARPAIGLDQEAAVHLVTAGALAAGHGYVLDSLPNPTPEVRYPPLFPALLAIWGFASQHALWLKLLPLACTAGWLWMMRKLLLIMGASWTSSFLLIALTAAYPSVIALASDALPQTLFGLLVAATLVSLLEDRAWLAGILAGMATLTEASGVALIAACAITLVARRRFRGAVLFAMLATVIAAPWFGWSLAHITHDARIAGTRHAPLTIFTSLAASEKAAVLGRNLFDLVASPVMLFLGVANTLSMSVTVLVVLGCLIARRRTMPDLFVFLYCAALLCLTTPPRRNFIPVLPLILWMVWRALRGIKAREALAAAVIIVMAIPIAVNVKVLLASRDSGMFPGVASVPNRWSSLGQLFDAIRTGAPPDALVLSNLDSLTYLRTGRKAVRGFDAGGFEMYYSPRHSPVTPDTLSRSISESRVGYVMLTPDDGLPESASFHRSVEALERGGVIEPVTVSGLAPGYLVFRVASR
jgi:hypothetical protein